MIFVILKDYPVLWTNGSGRWWENGGKCSNSYERCWDTVFWKLMVELLLKIKSLNTGKTVAVGCLI